MNLNNTDWVKTNIDLFKNKHRYYTSYALENWEPLKSENLFKMIESLEQTNTVSKKKEKK